MDSHLEFLITKHFGGRYEFDIAQKLLGAKSKFIKAGRCCAVLESQPRGKIVSKNNNNDDEDAEINVNKKANEAAFHAEAATPEAPPPKTNCCMCCRKKGGPGAAGAAGQGDAAGGSRVLPFGGAKLSTDGDDFGSNDEDLRAAMAKWPEEFCTSMNDLKLQCFVQLYNKLYDDLTSDLFKDLSGDFLSHPKNRLQTSLLSVLRVHDDDLENTDIPTLKQTLLQRRELMTSETKKDVMGGEGDDNQNQRRGDEEEVFWMRSLEGRGNGEGSGCGRGGRSKGRSGRRNGGGEKSTNKSLDFVTKAKGLFSGAKNKREAQATIGDAQFLTSGYYPQTGSAGRSVAFRR